MQWPSDCHHPLWNFIGGKEKSSFDYWKKIQNKVAFPRKREQKLACFIKTDDKYCKREKNIAPDLVHYLNNMKQFDQLLHYFTL